LLKRRGNLKKKIEKGEEGSLTVVKSFMIKKARQLRGWEVFMLLGGGNTIHRGGGGIARGGIH